MTSDCANLLNPLFDFVHPVFDSIKTLLISDVVDHNNAMGAMVVIASNCLEPFLTSSVPLLSLQFAVECTFH